MSSSTTRTPTLPTWVWLLLVLLPGLPLAAVETPTASETPAPAAHAELPRIVAIGDVHGAFEPLRAILREAELIDAEDRWIGGDAILVQTGDLLDRGARVHEVVELMRSLERQAPEHGGRVIGLLGNHETMNLLMDLRDVNPDSLEPWTSKRSERRRTVHCRRYIDIERDRARRSGREAPRRSELDDRCRQETPLGLLEYLDDLRADEDLGRWLRSRPTTARLGPWIFVHGGLSAAMSGAGVELVNRQIRQEIEAFDRLRRHLITRGLVLETAPIAELVAVARGLRQMVERSGAELEAPTVKELDYFLGLEDWWVLSPAGPLWYRGWAKAGPEDTDGLVSVIRAFGAERAVAGHTPRASHSIEGRLDDRVFLVDTGMLEEVYRGRPSALEIVGQRVTALYLGGERDVLLDPAP